MFAETMMMCHWVAAWISFRRRKRPTRASGVRAAQSVRRNSSSRAFWDSRNRPIRRPTRDSRQTNRAMRTTAGTILIRKRTLTRAALSSRAMT